MGPNQAEKLVKTLEEEVPTLTRLYNLLAPYEIIGLRKWAYIIRASRYVHGQSKVWFAGLTWTPNLTSGSIVLEIETIDAKYAEEMRKRANEQGVNAVVKKAVWKGREEGYRVVIDWKELKKYLCDENLKTQLIRAAQKAVENCYVWNLMHPDEQKDCGNINAAQWLKKLQDPQWLRENIGCGEA